MRKRLLAYFSPLKPDRSGVADYSERLLPGLADHFDIHLYGHHTPPSSDDLRNRFNWFPRRDYELQNRRTPYDLNIYHIGNSHIHQFIYPVMARYPGAVVLHDANIHHARAYSHLGHRNLGDYLDELEWCHGDMGRAVGPAMAHGYHSPVLYDRFPMLDIVCRGARSVLVHSRFAEKRVRGRIEADRVFRVNLPYFEEQLPDRTTARQRLGIPDDRLLVASFGFVTPGKGIETIVKAFDQFHKSFSRSICVLVGGCLEDNAFARRLHATLENRPQMRQTGYVDNQTYRLWMAAADIGICLRYPTQGETSDALLRLMGAGIPVIVPDYRQFREIPSDACVQIPVYPNESFAVLTALRLLSKFPETASEIGENARNYVTKVHGGDRWLRAFVRALEKTLQLPRPIPLGHRCPLRHVRVAPVEESVALALKDWGDVAKHPMIIDPLSQSMEELGFDGPYDN